MYLIIHLTFQILKPIFKNSFVYFEKITHADLNITYNLEQEVGIMFYNYVEISNIWKYLLSSLKEYSENGFEINKN